MGRRAESQTTLVIKAILGVAPSPRPPLHWGSLGSPGVTGGHLGAPCPLGLHAPPPASRAALGAPCPPLPSWRRWGPRGPPCPAPCPPGPPCPAPCPLHAATCGPGPHAPCGDVRPLGERAPLKKMAGYFRPPLCGYMGTVPCLPPQSVMLRGTLGPHTYDIWICGGLKIRPPSRPCGRRGAAAHCDRT